MFVQYLQGLLPAPPYPKNEQPLINEHEVTFKVKAITVPEAKGVFTRTLALRVAGALCAVVKLSTPSLPTAKSSALRRRHTRSQNYAGMCCLLGHIFRSILIVRTAF